MTDQGIRNILGEQLRIVHERSQGDIPLKALAGLSREAAGIGKVLLDAGSYETYAAVSAEPWRTVCTACDEARALVEQFCAAFPNLNAEQEEFYNRLSRLYALLSDGHGRARK